MEQLSKTLKNRHLQMIAIGGAIGTGFFLASASAIQMTGPSISLAYLFGGLIIYGIMLALGEMTVFNPASGSFVEYANNYIGNIAGFVSGWNAWLLFTGACMLEVTAVGTLLDYWFVIPHWLTCLVLLSLFTAVNAVGVKYFGEIEFWFSIVKIIVIVFMILTGIYLLITSDTIRSTASSNISLYSHLSVFFSNGLNGFLTSLVIVCLSFCGSEFVSVASGEAENPEKSIPKAINSVIIRIVLFYFLTIAVIVLIYPYSKINPNMNPFADVFAKIGMHNAAAFINAVAIIAALSSLNSCIYVASRFIYRLSLNNHAPKPFRKLHHSLPINAIVFTGIMCFTVVILSYFFPDKILHYLIALITVAIIINWYIILISHIFFRKKVAKENIKLTYKTFGYPYSNILIMIFMAILLYVMSQTPSMSASVYVAPAWLLFLLAIFLIKNKKTN